MALVFYTGVAVIQRSHGDKRRIDLTTVKIQELRKPFEKAG